jgi:hypothetical protein
LFRSEPKTFSRDFQVLLYRICACRPPPMQYGCARGTTDAKVWINHKVILIRQREH